jgi:predicted acetyltransferase
VAAPYGGRQAQSYNMEKSADERAVEVSDAVPAHARLIQNLMQLYTHDFSEFWAGTSRGDVDPEGLFTAYPLEDYWSRPNWSAGLIWCAGKLAGFALVNDITHSGLHAQRNMGEFFILRKYRGNGVGRTAAETLFSRQPGSWEVAVARRNSRALQFWRKVVRSSRQASGIEEIDVQSAHWDGPILRFGWSMM